MFLFFKKNVYLLTAKITPDVDNYVQFLHAVQELGASMTQFIVSDWYSMMDVACIC